MATIVRAIIPFQTWSFSSAAAQRSATSWCCLHHLNLFVGSIELLSWCFSSDELIVSMKTLLI